MNRLVGIWRRAVDYAGSAFPLLTRELIEQSARKRTYILRVVYAVAVYSFVLQTLWIAYTNWSSQSFAFLGRGRQLFDLLVMLQFWGLYLFLPAMTSGVLTAEKERDTLSLLLLTRLGSWSILIGKLLSRLIPMATFILLSLPLVAVAYSLGGLEADAILVLAWVLMITALQVGSLAVACSAWYRTTAGAFMATYLIGALLIRGLGFLTQGGEHDIFGIVEFIRASCERSGMGGIRDVANEVNFTREEAVSLFSGPWVCLHPNSQGQPFWNIAFRTLPMALFAVVCLVFARVVLWRRAFVKSSNRLLKTFRSLDALFHRLNQNRLTKGIVLIHDNVTLPLHEPIRWRETKKRTLGTTRYLIRLLLLLEVPVLFGMLIPLGADSPNFGGPVQPSITPVQISAGILWVVATLVIVIQSTGLIGAERSRQTLDVLLTTPMDSEQIVREKFAGVWRMIRMLWVPFATVYVFQFWWMNFVADHSFGGFDAFRGLLATAIYLPLTAWIGFHFSMRCRSQTQATLITLGLLTGLCLLPILAAEILTGKPNHPIVWLSPIMALTARRWLRSPTWAGYYDSHDSEFVPWVLMHFMVAGLLLALLWYRGLRTFAYYVKRNDGQIVDDEDIEGNAVKHF